MQDIWKTMTGNPTLLLEAVRQIVLALVLFGLVHWTDQQTAGLLMALSAILALFNRATVTPNSRVVTREDPATGQHVPGPAAASIVLLACVLGAGAIVMPACGNRYKAGTPIQNKLAYEMDEALIKIKEAQTKVIAAVDSGATPPAVANRFLDPIRDVTTLAKDRAIPVLEAYDAAVRAGDLVKQDALHVQLQPLMQEFYAKLAQAFKAPLPDNVIGSLAGLLTQIQETIRTVRQVFVPAVPGT
jgi:hypothetical protein